ncbi:AAA family ATPase [Actinoplanes aureus]|uniref:AAA family ATPase n=1 Tax=Actinoplanes aureus TaxID=2792083 RepID=A0A931C4Z1_9ACTN|nr:AAA family ATPase [Actinoplanes aureus]MBG0563495.1 AAA family ATPase [Actinoplanes aureus]
MDGTETGWGRPAEPAPRWRALLDRARHGNRSEEPEQVQPETQEQQQQQQWGQQPPASRGAAGVERRPFNPLDPRAAERRAAEPPPPPAEPRPMPQRPINPLDPRWQSRREAEQPSTYFDPAPRSAQPPTPPPAREYGAGTGYAAPAREYPPNGYAPGNGYPPQPNGYAPPAFPAQAAAAPAPAYPAPPVVPRTPAVQPSPTSPAPAAARIEWRQSRTDDGTDRAVAVMRRKLGKPRVLAFANPKGGVHKTTATVLAAATIGSVRGRGVLAWDDNELRGTLGLRAGSARHARTIKHLLADLMRIENLHGDALLQELDAYLRHASDGSYDVLAGEENPRFAQRLDQGTVRRVMDLLRRTHDVICVDTGNNVESVNWQTVMRTADQLVITTVPREDAAFTADWMLDVLEESGMGDMVANAVTLISCPSPGHLPLLGDFQKHFATRTRAVAVVPYDPALEVGSSIEYADLQNETRQAWLRAASVMLEPFAE